jgi:hypothetical protein
MLLHTGSAAIALAHALGRCHSTLPALAGEARDGNWLPFAGLDYSSSLKIVANFA